MARRKEGARAWVRVSHRTKDLPASRRRWEVVYEDPNQGFKRRTKGGFATKGAAEAWRDDDECPVRKKPGEWVDPARGDETFQAVAQKWLSTYPRTKARTYGQHDQIVNGERSLLRMEFGDRRIGDITHSMVGVWIRRMEVDHGRSPSTIRHQFYTLRRVMRFAQAEGLIHRDPTAGIDTPSMRGLNVEQADRYAVNVPEVAALTACLPEPWDMYVRLAAATGMRPEELCGLQLRDLGEDCGSVAIRRVVVKAKGALIYENQAKTSRSHRTIELDDQTASLLVTYVADHKARALRWFSEHHQHEHPGDFLPLFVGVGEFKRGHRQRKVGADLDWLDFSKPADHGWFRMRYWDAARKQAGLPSSVRFYDLRHFHATWLVDRLGQPGALTITEISERLGHASTSMTLNRYSHSGRGRSVEKKRALGAMWAPSDEAVVTRLPRRT